MNRLQRREESQLEALQAELAPALAAGERSQRRLEAFLAKDDAGALRRESRANDSAVEALWAVRNGICGRAGGKRPDAATVGACGARRQGSARPVGECRRRCCGP